MAIRRSGMTLGGKLSLGYLCVATFLFVTGGRASEWFLMVLGFPLVYAPWVYEQASGEVWQPRPTIRVLEFVLLWVGNAYLWGHSIALVVRWLGRRPAPLGEPRPIEPIATGDPAPKMGPRR